MIRHVLMLSLMLFIVVAPAIAEQIAVPKNIVVTHADAIPQSASQERPASAVIAKDAETGELRAPTADEMQSLTAPLAVAQRQPRRLTATVQSTADGMLSATLDASHENLSVAVRTADGRVAHVCALGDAGLHVLENVELQRALIATPEEK